MAIAFRDSDTGILGAQSGTIQTLNIVIPSTVQAGDLMLIFIEINSASANYSLGGPGDWTQLQYLENGSQQAALYSKVAQAGDASTSATFTIEALAGGTGAKGTATLVAYSGAQLGISAVFGDATVSTTHPTPVVTPASYPALVVVGLSKKGDGLTTMTPPAGYTARDSVIQSGGGSCGTAAADIALASGSSDGGSWTTDISNRNFATFSVALTETPPPPAGAVIWKRSAGAWVATTISVRGGGIWNPASIKLRSGGTWT